MEITGILHAHSRYSYDAKLTLPELRKLCISRGIGFVCMTEHTDEFTPSRAAAFVRECDTLSDETFRFIPGFEVPYKVNAEGREGALGHARAHILMIGMREFFEPYAPSIEVLREWSSRAEFVVLAHPVRNHFVVTDDLLAELDALEVWNQQYEGKRVPRTRSLKLFDELKIKKPNLIATGGVDFHRAEHFGAPLVTLTVDTLTEAAIMEKLTTGAFIIQSERALVYGSLPDAKEKARTYALESALSVFVIRLGKMVNKVLAACGLSLPASLKRLVRRRL